MDQGKTITVTPALASFATPYSSGDVMGILLTLTDAVLTTKGSATLENVVCLDKANAKSALDLIFFDEAPVNSVGADNAAYGLNDADLSKCIGRVSVASADYVSSGSNNAESNTNTELDLQAKAGTRNLYCLVVCRGTPTYGSATDLSIKLNLRQR